MAISVLLNHCRFLLIPRRMWVGVYTRTMWNLAHVPFHTGPAAHSDTGQLWSGLFLRVKIEPQKPGLWHS